MHPDPFSVCCQSSRSTFSRCPAFPRSDFVRVFPFCCHCFWTASALSPAFECRYIFDCISRFALGSVPRVRPLESVIWEFSSAVYALSVLILVIVKFCAPISICFGSTERPNLDGLFWISFIHARLLTACIPTWSAASRTEALRQRISSGLKSMKMCWKIDAPYWVLW